MSKQYRVGVVGIGAVGGEMIRVLRERNFPASEIRILARSAREEQIDGQSYAVHATEPEAFDGLDFAFFAGTEGASGASRQFGWEAVKRGVVVIDNGNDFRLDERVPLVVPEVNAEALDAHQGFIANPNCSTIIALTVLGPLHRAATLTRLVASTYQAVSGTGRAAIDELDRQARAYVAGEPLKAEAYPYPIAFNVLPQIGSENPAQPGYTSEEAKMLFESRKILGTATLKASTTCVRVPVFNGHAESLNASFAQPLSVADARRILADAPGVKLVDDLGAKQYPMPIDISGTDAVAVGRIRRDETVENGLALWVAGDNIRKGAALNAIQIAETMLARGLVRC